MHVDSVEMARGLAWPMAAGGRDAGPRFWPGPLTLVLPQAAVIPDIVTAGLPTVGIRATGTSAGAGADPGRRSAHRRSQRESFRAPVSDHRRNMFATSSGGTGRSASWTAARTRGYRIHGALTGGLAAATAAAGRGVPAQIEALIGGVELAGRVENGAQPSPGMHARTTARGRGWWW